MEVQRFEAVVLAFMLTLGAAVGLVVWSGSNAGGNSALHEKNARAGFAAQTWFEVVSARDVAAAVAAGSAETYALDPNKDAYKAKEKGLAHLRYVTWLRRAEGEDPAFLFDLFLHGDLSDPDALVIRVPRMDIRKFLFEPITSLSEDESLVRLQAYFEEFSRKAKLIYRRPGQGADLADSGYERAMLERLRRDLGLLAAGLDPRWRPYGDRIRRVLAQLDVPRLIDWASVERNLSLAMADVEGAGTAQASTGSADAEGNALSTLRRAASAVTGLGAVEKVAYVKIVNNCREPGNYEISLEDWLERPILKGSFAFATDTYDRILEQYAGLNIAAIGSGVRVSGSVWPHDLGHYWRSLLPWRWLKRIPPANIAALISNGSAQRRAEAGRQGFSGRVDVSRGRIPFEDYEIEVRSKSAFQIYSEPLSYVGVEPSKPMPRGFQAPDRSAPAGYWAAPEHAGLIVPHKFAYFEDLQRYDVYLSGFEVNGVYIGRTDLQDYDKLRKEGRWKFDYGYLSQLRLFEFHENADGVVWIEVLSESPSDDAVNFLVGNLRLAVGESVEYPFGIGTQPLISDYNEDVFQDRPRYALAYGGDGTILDHHERRIGVERVYVERTSRDAYKLRLIAHERILPVWEGVLRTRPR